MEKCLVHTHILLSCWGFTGMSAQGLHAEDPRPQWMSSDTLFEAAGIGLDYSLMSTYCCVKSQQC